MASEKLVRKCLYNWLGYGELNSPIWIIGTEEGGSADIPFNHALKLRSGFETSMDFSYVWNKLYELDLQNIKLGGIWKFVASFLLNMREEERNKKDIKRFIWKELGRKDADHFMGEFLPLPKSQKNSIERYDHIWPTIQDYHEEVVPQRLSIIVNNIEENEKVKLIVSYEKMFTQQIRNYYGNRVSDVEEWSYKKQKYFLCKINLFQDRKIFLLSTPFFGQGQISYDGLDFAAQKVKSLIL